MAFSAQGPAPLNAASVFDIAQGYLDRKRKAQVEDAQLAAEGARTFGQSVQAMNARQDGSDFTDQQLAMTPGVTRGGSTATTGEGVTDSPLMKSASTQFERFGKMYSFNPVAAGEQQGEAAGAKANAEDSARYKAMLNIPGFTPLKAAREVYGRSGVLDIPDPHESRAALANYMLHPTLENASSAIMAGANLSNFPSPSNFNPDGSLKAAPPKSPVPGSQAWLEEEKAKYQIANDAELDRQTKLKTLSAALTSPAKEETSSRLALDAVRKTAPRPSKVDSMERPVSAGGYSADPAGGPTYQRTVADSLDWDRSQYQPAVNRFRDATGSAAPPSPETSAANTRMQMWHDRFGAGTLPNQAGPGEGLTDAAKGVKPAAAPAAPDTSAWTSKNPPKEGESLEDYKKRAAKALSSSAPDEE